MDDPERAFRDALHRVDTMTIPVPPVQVDELSPQPQAGRMWAHWLASVAAIAVAAGLGIWALAGPGRSFPAVPGAPSPVATSATSALVGVTWMAVELSGKPVVAVGLEVPNVAFYADGRFSGGDPCNGITGTYRLDGEQVQITRTGFSTTVGCDPGQQGRFVTALDDARRAVRTGDLLVLRNGAGTELGRFQATAPQANPTMPPIPSSGVEVRIWNNTGVELTDVHIPAAIGDVSYDTVAPGELTAYQQVDLAPGGSALFARARKLVAVGALRISATQLAPGHYTLVLTKATHFIGLTLQIDG